MEKITKGDLIEILETGSYHVADEIEHYEEVSVVYTEDNKCFSLNSVKKITNSELNKCYEKVIYHIHIKDKLYIKVSDENAKKIFEGCLKSIEEKNKSFFTQLFQKLNYNFKKLCRF